MLVDSSLLGLASEIEIGNYSPSFKWLNLLIDQIRNFSCGSHKLIPAAGGIRKNHQKENRRFALPVRPKRRSQTEHVWTEMSGCARYCRVESRLLGECGWNIHTLLSPPLRDRAFTGSGIYP
jgi:hypothetical protein